MTSSDVKVGENFPSKIFLHCDTDDGKFRISATTWCEDRVDNGDVEYHRYHPEELRGKYKPNQVGDSHSTQMLCSHCDFPKKESLTFDMKHCFNCGCELDWSDYEQQLKGLKAKP